jgi:ribosomal protein S18 acetylase RimI-like enzyme
VSAIGPADEVIVALLTGLSVLVVGAGGTSFIEVVALVLRMKVHEATPEDVKAVQEVAQASWHAAHEQTLGTSGVEELLDEWYDRDGLRERITREEGPMFLAVEDGEVVGFTQGVLGEDSPAEAVVGSIYVFPEYWNEGIGTELLYRLFDAFREKDWNSVCLAVMAENDVARSFYDKHGFEIHEERTVELADQEIDDVVLIRDL